MAGHFADPRVGAIQIGVRISQRQRLLRQLQDFEFLVFARIIQRARNHIGSVGLGGNGQFTRLSALASLGANPWSDCLTEDLDLGLRLVSAGWKNTFCPSTNVTQQGLDNIRQLVRQRTRWSHGHLQCWKRIPQLVRSPLPTRTVLDLLYYLLAPSLTLVGSIVLVAPWFWLTTVALLQPNEFAAWATSAQGRGLFILFYTLSFGTSIIWSLVYRRISGEMSVGRALLLAHVLPFYNLIWHLATWKAVARILLRRQTWTKTERAIEIPKPDLTPLRAA
jgi:cellulose synthase/poly-beta-1,6-N-acetylglucosamine synthase-like glycosyltransferase